MRQRKAKGKMELLRNVSLFSACTTKELAKIASLVDDVDASSGEILAREGTPGREFFVIARGNAKVAIRGKKIATLGPGDFFGEMALVDQGPRSATVTADGSMSLYVLDSQHFAALLDQVPAIARKILKGIAQRLRDAEKAPTY
jgi:CRP-like cAMP-binding protein